MGNNVEECRIQIIEYPGMQVTQTTIWFRNAHVKIRRQRMLTSLVK